MMKKIVELRVIIFFFCFRYFALNLIDDLRNRGSLAIIRSIEVRC